MVNYSIYLRKNPNRPDEDKKVYGTVQYSEVMGIDKFAAHIASHGCVYSRADIASILTMAVDCMKEQLLAGQKVCLGDLGSFYLSMSCRGALTPDAFKPEIHVKKLYVNWERGVLFTDLKEEATFNLVANRKAQRLITKALKAGQTSVELVEPESAAGGEPDGEEGAAD